MDAVSLVFLEECGINTGATRLYGRALGGNRIFDYVPDVRREEQPCCNPCDLMGLLCRSALTVTDFLAPTLRPGDIVFMDQLSSQKVEGIAEEIEEIGAIAVYLPQYSSDLNPIEYMWSKIKAYLRKVKARTKDALLKGFTLRSARLLDSSNRPSRVSGKFPSVP